MTTAFLLEDFRRLLEPQRFPCLSLYVPTHRRPPEAEEDPVRYKNLLSRAEAALRERGSLSNSALQEFLAPLERLNEPDFWVGHLDGLAIFRSPDFFAVHRVPEPVEELAAVAENFRTRPLLPLLSQTGRYFVLALSQGAVTLYSGSRYILEEIDVPTLPRGLWDAVGREPTQDPQNFKWHQKGRNPMFTGHGVGPNDNEADRQRYFRQVDEIVCEQLKGEQAPLVLAGPADLWPTYRAVSRYPRLVEGGVEGNVEHDRPEAIQARAWPLVEPLFQERQRTLVEQFRELAAKGRASDDLATLAQAAASGRVAALLLAEGRHLEGRFDRQHGEVIPVEASGPAGGNDALDDLAEETLRRGGEAYLMPADQMPTGAPAAAVFRY